MKNQDKHPIDDYFKDYMEQDFPYNPSSWNKATKVIDAYFGKRKKSVLIIAFFLVASSIALFLAFDSIDSKNKTSVKSIATSPINKEKELKNINSFNQVETKIDNPTAKDVANQTKSSNGNLMPKSIETFSQEEIRKTQITGEVEEISGKDKHNNIPISITTESHDSITAKEKSTFFTDFMLDSKLLYSFNFNASNKHPETIIGKERRKKKFAFMIELESQLSTNTKQKSGGLSQAELDYKTKYESAKNTKTGYLNFMFQRGKFGFITGLGYQKTITNTNYLVNKVYYDTKILYKTENKFVPSSSGYYLIITTRVDTLGKRTEVVKIANQANQNTFEWLLVPLKISYQYPYNRFRFSIRTGVDLSWLYNAKGAFINSDLKSVSSITNNDLKRFNATMSAQFMTGYQVNKRFQIGGSMHYSNQLGSNFKNYSSRFQNTGLGLYVRMGF